MNDILGSGGIYFDPAPSLPPSQNLDLGEEFRRDFLSQNFWSRYNGYIYPTLPGDKVVIGGTTPEADEHLTIYGKLYASGGYTFGNGVSVTKDGSNNLVFTDPVTGTRTLAQLAGLSGGNVMNSGTPTVGQLARWVNATTIEGFSISSLTLAQSQITNLVGDLAGKASTIHNLVDTTNHPVSGLTTGHFLKALSATTYGFAVHGLTKTDIGLSNVTNDAQIKKITSSTDNQIVRWDGITGDQVQGSVVTISDGGTVNLPSGQTYNINGSPHNHAGVYQPADGTLTALAGLDGTTGFLYQTGVDTFVKYGFAGTGSANTVARSDHNHTGTYLTANQTIVLSGDITGTGTTAITTTLRTLIEADIPTLSQSKITNLTTDLGNKQPLDADLTSIAGLGFTALAYLKKTAANTWALDTEVIVSVGAKATGVDAGTLGQICIDDDYIYVCTTGGGVGVAVWKRVAITTVW